MPKMTHAVVVRGELNGLGVIRSLARAGIPTVLVDTTRARAAAWSRFCDFQRVERLYGAGLVDDLLALQARLGERPVLILTDEMAVTTVSQYRDRLAAAYRFALPAAEMVSRLGDKAQFQAFAEANGVPVPRAVALRQECDLAKLVDLRFPAIVKPADKRGVYFGETERIHRVADLAACTKLCDRLVRSAGELVVQEWINGPDSNIFFSLFHQGDDQLAIFSGRKLIVHPPGIGSTAFCVAAADEAAEIESLTRRFIALTQYRGLGGLELKFDSVHRRFVVVEPTVGRTDWQEEIATLSGVNIPLAAYRYAMGLPPLPRTPQAPTAAWQASILHWRGRTALPSRMRVFDGYWRLRDPLPALVHYGTAIAKRLTRRRARHSTNVPQPAEAGTAASSITPNPTTVVENLP